MQKMALLLLICSIIANLLLIEGFYWRSDFSCEYYMGNSRHNVRYQRSSVNSSAIFIYMDRPTYDYLSFDEAAKICKLCHNADLILAQDVPELDDDALPAWIGVTAQATLMDNQLTNVTWTPHIMENLVWPTGMNINGTFAALAQPKKSFQNHTFLAVPLNIRWFYGVYPHGADSKVDSLICKTIKENDTHQWSFDDENCIYHPKFGCHTYENHLQRSEDQNGTFITNMIRKAKPCPIVNCTCSVTQWKQWSSCNEFICTDKPQNRVRSREIVEFCRQDHLHEMLSESEPCPLPSGCDQLEKFHESNVGLVMNV